MERHTISKGEIVYSCRRQNRDNIWAVFLGVYALRSVMENHIISKGEKERVFLRIKENKNTGDIPSVNGIFPVCCKKLFSLNGCWNNNPFRKTDCCSNDKEFRRKTVSACKVEK